MCFAAWLASRCGLLERVRMGGTLRQPEWLVKIGGFQTETLPEDDNQAIPGERQDVLNNGLVFTIKKAAEFYRSG